MNPNSYRGEKPAEWLRRHFPTVARVPLGARHKRLWDWLDGLKPGERQRTRVEVWGRGGAKSSTAELGCTFLAAKGSKKFCLYVSGTHDQANKHVGSIKTQMEAIGMPPLLGDYKNVPKGWNLSQVRCANGFNVVALGLNAAARGIKLDDVRPDLIIFDDIDDEVDTPETIAKKVAAITGKILPTGSPDASVLFIQNLIHEESIVSTLVSDTAEFLYDRDVPPIEPAVFGLVTESYDRGDGRQVYRIVGGTPSWEGQNLDTCESQINTWGLAAFLREAQHEVHGADGFFFNADQLAPVDQLPDAALKFARGWDLAATENGGDYTVGTLLAHAPNGVVYVADVRRGRLGADKVLRLIKETCAQDVQDYGLVQVVLPIDPGAAGKIVEAQLRSELADFNISFVRPDRKKAIRARGLARKVNEGNVRILKGDWNNQFRREFKLFREDETHEHDDQVDATADAYNWLAPFYAAKKARSYVSSGTGWA